MTVSIEQANAIIKELREVNSALQKENEFLCDEVEELKFELSCRIDREYDV